MKREIKFRAFDKISKQMYQWSQIASISLVDFEKEHYELMQFTGLKDKNGIDIYEGDIMKITLEGLVFWEKQKDLGKIGEVIYNEDYAGYIIQWEYSKNQHHESLNCDIACTGEIIGNIHENTELLC